MLGYFGLWLHRPQVSPELTMEKSPRMIFLHLFHTVLLNLLDFLSQRRVNKLPKVVTRQRDALMGSESHSRDI